MIDDLLEYNRAFVAQNGYEKYVTNKYPDKKIAIVTCMDTRLLKLLPAALGLKKWGCEDDQECGGYGDSSVRKCHAQSAGGHL